MHMATLTPRSLTGAFIAFCFFGAIIPILADPNSQTNTLSNSGTLEEFANTQIYSSDGMSFKVGAVGADAFDLTTRLQTALNAAVQAGNVVKGDWSSETGFEEWRDRLLLLKKTTFFILDVSRIGKVGQVAGSK